MRIGAWPTRSTSNRYAMSIRENAHHVLAAGALLVALVVAAWFWHQDSVDRHHATPQAPGSGQKPVPPEVEATPTASDTSAVPMAVAGTVSGIVASLDELRRLCPDPWTEGVPDACIAALASRYRQEGMRTVRPHHDGGGWAPPGAPLSAEVTWNEAFAKSGGDAAHRGRGAGQAGVWSFCCARHDGEIRDGRRP